MRKKSLDRGNGGNKHVMVKGLCNNRNCMFFIDTGSSVSLVSWGFILQAGLEDCLQRSNVNLSSFTQNPIPIRGEIQLVVKIAGSNTEHKFLVTDLLDTEFLIGSDFLTAKQCSVNYHSKRLILPNGKAVEFKLKHTFCYTPNLDNVWCQTFFHASSRAIIDK